MTELKALLWDVDGVLAETERDGHRIAFNQAFEAAGVPWRWDVAQYVSLLAITGGRERLLHDMTSRPDAPPTAEQREALARTIHAKKNALYAQMAPRIPLREGVLALMQECRAEGVRMGIAASTSRSNVEALLGAHLGARWTDWFAVVVCGDDVKQKKPDPDIYELALRNLRIGPLDAVAIEDSPGGVAAARAADIPVIVTRSACFATATIEGAIAIGPGLSQRSGWRPALAGAQGDAQQVGLDDIAHWRTQMDSVSQFG